MIKLTGMVLIAVCCWMTGREFSVRTAKRVSSIEAALSLLGYLYGRLQYLQPPVGQLICQAAESSQFSSLDYLKNSSMGLRQGDGFSESWKRSVKASQCDLSKEDRILLEELGDILGASDLESQLGALKHLKERMGVHLREADQYRQKHGKMYQALGLLTGLAIVIVMA